VTSRLMPTTEVFAVYA